MGFEPKAFIFSKLGRIASGQLSSASEETRELGECCGMPVGSGGGTGSHAEWSSMEQECSPSVSPGTQVLLKASTPQAPELCPCPLLFWSLFPCGNPFPGNISGSFHWKQPGNVHVRSDGHIQRACLRQELYLLIGRAKW